MSAFVCGQDHFKALAIFATTRRHGSLRVDPRYVDGLESVDPQVCQDELACVYADVLYRENVRSCFVRYPREDLDSLPGEFEKPDTVTVTHGDIVRAAYRLPAVSILKMCDCLEYQSCESDNWRETVAYRLLNSIRRAAIRELVGYDDAPWDFSVARSRAG